MKSDPECLVCLLKQGLNATRLVTEDPAIQREVLDRIGRRIPELDLSRSPAEISTRVYAIVSEVTGINDPYESAKTRSNQEALELLPELERVVANAVDPLQAALRLAVAGNVIDLGIGHAFNLSEDVTKILQTDFAVDDYQSFKKELRRGTRLLYLGDNAGEIVFDKVLVKELLKREVGVTFCVKSAPIINDATMEDARIAGITELVPVIETGSNDIGINLDRAGETFLEALGSSDVIVAKGHGNFETCSDLPYKIYFLLKAKCAVVARELGVRKGDLAFKHQKRQTIYAREPGEN